jgi:hypothetical protein
MAQKEQICVTEGRAKYRCPPGMQELIELVNSACEAYEVIEKEYEKEHLPPPKDHDLKSICKSVHELAQMAALPADIWRDYVKAVIGTVEEWEIFCRKLPAPLWRKWPEIDMRGALPFLRTWPQLTISLVIGSDYRVSAPEQYHMTALIGIDARRLRECRVCWRIFWASRVEKTGGPYGCSAQCNNTLRQRNHKERKKP